MKFLKVLIVLLVVAAIGVGGYFILINQGIIWRGDLDKKLYSVRGIAVDETNDKIDWTEVKKSEEVQFAFIRATKGSALRDKCYIYNNSAATKADIKISPYLEYQVGVEPDVQFKSFKNTVKPVPLGTNMPQCIKLFIDSDVATMDSDARKAEAKKIFSLCTLMSEYYGKYPILYTTEDTYKNIIKDESEFDSNDLCVENTKRKALLSYSDDWYFWQYKNDYTVKGCKRPVNRLVYKGSVEEFKNYWLIKNK